MRGHPHGENEQCRATQPHPSPLPRRENWRTLRVRKSFASRTQCQACLNIECSRDYPKFTPFGRKSNRILLKITHRQFYIKLRLCDFVLDFVKFPARRAAKWSKGGANPTPTPPLWERGGEAARQAAVIPPQPLFQRQWAAPQQCSS